jgi:Xaa-Pro dipeptidase
MTNLEPNAIHRQRQVQLARFLQEHDLDALALNPGPSLQYFTGIDFHLSERPIVFLFATFRDQDSPIPPVAVLPEFEAGRTEDLSFPVQTFAYAENPASWGRAFDRAAQAARIGGGQRIGVEGGHFRLLELRFLEGALPKAEFLSAEEVISAMRMHKGAQEISAMRKAVKIAQEALLNTLPLVKVGMRERQLASELTAQLLRGGSSPDLAFFPLVSSGPNGANPHARPGERQLIPGDLLIIDWGARVDGYVSDITRTFAIGEVEGELQKIANIVAQANAAGREAARPGITAGEVDEAARAVIEQAGYGEYFTHRTGHGIGLEGHEPPYLFAENQLSLAPGMTFTVEPGIYIPKRGGVRVEDNVLVTAEGSESLTDLPRELKVIG